MKFNITIDTDTYAVGVSALDRDAFIKNYPKWINDDEVTQYMFQGTFPTNWDDAQCLYDQFQTETNVIFGIYVARMLVGTCGIYDIHWPSRIGEFRILIGDKSLWNKGIGFKCLNYMTKLAFERYNLYKLWLGYRADNIKAAQSYVKSNFKHECTIKHGHYRNGKYCDLERMCIFRDEYFKSAGSQP